MAKRKFASLTADMIRTVQPKRTVIIGPDGEHLSTWGYIPTRAA